jgi:acyl-coenzyme A synthetase/AMP-(fatty) acid ligase
MYFSRTDRGACGPEHSAKRFPASKCGCATMTGSDLPDGEIGALWVRGGARAWGYFRESDKTQATFRGEWVVPGDLISRDAEGFFTYQGRGDDVFKVGGRWFSPAEVEGTLLRHPAVAECAVIGVADANGLQKPHAWVIPKLETARLARSSRTSWRGSSCPTRRRAR